MTARRILTLFVMLATMGTTASCTLFEELEPPGSPTDVHIPDAGGDAHTPDTDVDARGDTTQSDDIQQDVRVEPTLAISPDPARVALRATLQLQATYHDDTGQLVPDAVVDWQVADTAVASVTPTGLLVGMGIGQTEVTAQVNQTSQTVTVDVFSPIERIELTPASAVVDIDATTQFTATLYDGDDAVLTGFEVTWESSDETVATIDAQGLLTGVSEGAATIRAEAPGAQAQAQVQVFAPVDRVLVQPEEATIEVTESVQLSAQVFDIYDVLREDRPVTWTSLEPEVASVDATGLVRGLREGQARIVAQSGDQQAEASIVVEAPVHQVSITPQPASVGVGQTLQLSANLSDAAGNPLQGREVLWETSDASIATIDTLGLVEGKVGGRVTITATSEGISATARVDVANPVAQIVVTPDPLQLDVLETQQMTAELRDAGGNLLQNRAVTWRSSDPNIASVDTNGLVTAQNAGSVEISASAEGVRASALVTVRNVVTTIEITPAQTTIEVTDIVQMTAIAKNARGFVIPGLTATWTSSHPAVVTVTSDGRIEGVRGGTATITAQIEAVTASAEIQVDAPARSITLSPTSQTLEITDTLRINAQLKDKGGNVLSGRTIQWTSDAPTIASVDASGLVSAHARGTTTIRAQADYASASAAITVETPPYRIVLTPGDDSLEITDTLQLTASVQDKAGNALSGQTVQWVSDAPSIASVTSTGKVTALAGGSTTIRATAGPASAARTLTVDTPVRTIQLTPTTQSLEITDTAQLTAQLRDKAGNLLTGRTIQWTSSAPSIVSVNPTGKVTALAAGSANIQAQADFAQASATVQVTTPVHSITLSPTSQTLEVTKTKQFTATAKDKAGNPLSGQTFQWQVAHASIASVSTSGKVTALAAGTTNVQARIGSVSASAAVTVITPPRTLTITPNPATLMMGGTMTLSATARDLAGNVVSAPTPTWTSDEPNIASVTASGAGATLHAHAQGSTQVRASIQDPVNGTIHASATVNVQPQTVSRVAISPARLVLFPGDNATLNASCLDANDNPVSGINITWSSDNPATASVASATGKVTGHAIGATVVRASCAGIIGQIPVEIARWQQVEATRHFTCGVLTSGDAYCWGRNNVDGVLGNGSNDSGVDDDHLNHDADALIPTRVESSARFTRIAPGMFHACALDDTGQAYCWGSGGAGHLGNGQYLPSATPVQVSGTHRFQDIGVGANHACALALNGEVYCWGYNGLGQLGQGSGGASSYSAPRRVGTRKYTNLSVGANHNCAIGENTLTYCWGEGEDGRLGDGGTTNRSTPTQVDTTHTFVQVAAGYDHTCAITSNGKMFCWGLNDYRQLGDGTEELWQLLPVAAHAPEAFAQVAVGSGTTCGITASGHAYCWGFNGQGNLANGSVSAVEVGPAAVGGIDNITSFSLGLQHSCALSATEFDAFCAGDNDFGQLGTGTLSNYSSYPVRVEHP